MPTAPHTYLHLIITSNLMIELLDQLQGTNYYNGLLKNRVKMLLPELEKIVNREANNICHKVNGNALPFLLKNQEAFAAELSQHYTSDYPILTGLLKSFRQDPEKVMQALEIQVIENGKLKIENETA